MIAWRPLIISHATLKRDQGEPHLRLKHTVPCALSHISKAKLARFLVRLQLCASSAAKRHSNELCGIRKLTRAY